MQEAWPSDLWTMYNLCWGQLGSDKVGNRQSAYTWLAHYPTHLATVGGPCVQTYCHRVNSHSHSGHSNMCKCFQRHLP